MGGYNVGDLFGELILNDSQFAEALQRSSMGSKLLNQEISKLGAGVLQAANTLVAMGASLDDVAVALGLDADKASELLGRIIELTGAQGALTEAIAISASAQSKSMDAQIAHYHALVEADRIRTTQLKANYAVETDRAALASRLRAEELAAQRAQVAATEVGIAQEAAYRNAVNAERMASDVAAAGLKAQLTEEEAAANVLRANQEAQAVAMMAASEKEYTAVWLRLLKERDAADKAAVDARILRANQEAQAVVMAAAIENEAGNGANLGARLTGSGISPRGYIGNPSGGLIAAGAAAFATFELTKYVVVAADAARETQNLADRLNITWSEARNLEQGAKLAGIQVGGLQQSAFHLAQALEDSSGAGKKTAMALESMGVTGSNSGELLLNFLTALSKITDETKRIDLLHDVFQRQSQTLLPYVKNLSDLNGLITLLGPNIDANMTAKLEDAAKAFSILGIAWDKFKERTATGPVGTGTKLGAIGTATLLTMDFNPFFFLTDRSQDIQKGEAAVAADKALAAKALAQGQEAAHQFKDLHHNSADELRRDLDTTKKLIAELYSDLGSTINPITDAETRAIKENTYNAALQEELRIQKAIKDLAPSKDDTASLFSSVGLSDFKGRIRSAVEALDELTKRGLLNPAQVEMANQGIRKLREEFAALGQVVTPLGQPTNVFGTNELVFQLDELIRTAKEAEQLAHKLNSGIRKGTIGSPESVDIPMMLDDSANNTEKASKWAETWEVHLAKVTDEIAKINRDLVKTGEIGPGGPENEILRIEQFAKAHGLRLFRRQDLDEEGYYAKKVFDDVKRYVENGGNITAAEQYRVSQMLIQMFEDEAKTTGETAEQVSQRHHYMINGVMLDYDALKDRVRSNLGVVAQTWKDLVSDIQGAVLKTLGNLGSSIFDTLFPNFTNPKASNPLQPLIDSLRSAYEELSSYSNPKQALMDLVTSIQKAGSASQANAIAVRYFGNQAGPLLAAELRNGTISAKDLATAINAATASTVDYANKTSDQVSQLTLLWRQLVKDVVVAIMERLIGLALVSLLVWLGIINKNTNTLASAIDQVFTKLSAKLVGLFKTIQAEVTAAVKLTVKNVENIINNMHATATVDIVTYYTSVGSPGGGGGDYDPGSLFRDMFNPFGGGNSGGIFGGYDPFESLTNAVGGSRPGIGPHGPSSGFSINGPITVVTNSPKEFVRQMKQLRVVQNT